jgi:hypothetical protein
MLLEVDRPPALNTLVPAVLNTLVQEVLQSGIHRRTTTTTTHSAQTNNHVHYSRFFQTGAAGKASGSLMGHRAAGYSPHGVGGGAASSALHNAQQGGALAPHVGYGNDATHAQVILV